MILRVSRVLIVPLHKELKKVKKKNGRETMILCVVLAILVSHRSFARQIYP